MIRASPCQQHDQVISHVPVGKQHVSRGHLVLTAVAAQHLKLRHIQDRAAPGLSLLRSCPAAPGRGPPEKTQSRQRPQGRLRAASSRSDHLLRNRTPCAHGPHRPPPGGNSHAARRHERHPLSWQPQPWRTFHRGCFLFTTTARPRRRTTRTVFLFERLQRVPDLHCLTFLPTCSSTNPTPDGIPTAKSGSWTASATAPLDRATSAPFAGADPAVGTGRSSVRPSAVARHDAGCSRSRMASACLADFTVGPQGCDVAGLALVAGLLAVPSAYCITHYESRADRS